MIGAHKNGKNFTNKFFFCVRKWYFYFILPDFGAKIGSPSQSLTTNFISNILNFMCFVRYCTQNELIIHYTPIYPYKAIIRLNLRCQYHDGWWLSVCKFEVLMVRVCYLYNRTVQTILYGYSTQP